LTILLILVVGDVGAVEEWPLALLGFLLESDYSRGFESEADEYAFERMLAMDMDQAHFGRMLGASPEKTGGSSRMEACRTQGKRVGWSICPHIPVPRIASSKRDGTPKSSETGSRQLFPLLFLDRGDAKTLRSSNLSRIP